MLRKNQKLIVANWKMNTSPTEGLNLLNKIIGESNEVRGVEVVICPPSTHIFPFREALNKSIKTRRFELGSQNINQHEMGAYTGEVSVNMIKDYVKFVIVGHSERRKYYNETDEEISKKIELALRHNLNVILCVGEDERQRLDGNAKQSVLDQLNVDLSSVTKDDLDKLIIAYEPVWAIGTGNFAKPDEVKDMIDVISSNIGHIFHTPKNSITRILYGGSVNSDNAGAYLKINGVDGLLLGGASLNYKEFIKIVYLAKPRAEISI